MKIVDLLVRVKLASSKGDATKLVKAGGVSVDDQLISDPAVMVSALSGGNAFLLRKGKKTYHRVAIGTLK
jgi:tyrosyl-tRNA synthetase